MSAPIAPTTAPPVAVPRALPGALDHTLGALRTNAWLNLLWVALGALGLLLAGTFSRAYALLAGSLLTVLAIWGLILSPGAAILGFLPAAGANEAVNLTLGLLGLFAAAGSPRRQAAPSERPVSASRAAPERTSPLL